MNEASNPYQGYQKMSEEDVPLELAKAEAEVKKAWKQVKKQWEVINKFENPSHPETPDVIFIWEKPDYDE
jgi:hypothetical protein